MEGFCTTARWRTGAAALALLLWATASSAEVVDAGSTVIITDGSFTLMGSLEDGPGGGGTVIIGPTNPVTALEIGNDNRDVTFSGVISGMGSLFKSGDGMQVFTGTSVIGGDLLFCAGCGGGIDIQGGSFTVGGVIDVTTGTLKVTNGGTLNQLSTFGAPAGLTIGAHMLVDGAGSTATAHGITLVGDIFGFPPPRDSSLTITNGGVVNSLLGAVIIGTGGDVAVTVAGTGSAWNVEGDLAMVCLCGPSVLNISDGGVVNVSGFVAMDAGAVINIGSRGGPAGHLNTTAIAMLPGSEINANFSGSTTLAANIGGLGTITKDGPGTLTLSGDNANFGGTVSVDAGLMIVSGDTGSAFFTINRGGTLGGTGLAGETLVAGGTIAPGNSIGTLGIADSVTFAAGSSYAVEVSTTADRINVVPGSFGPGDATLSGGKVAPVYLSGGLLQRQYTVLNAAGGLGGTTFTGLDGVPPGIVATLTYDANNVYLNHDVRFLGIPGLTRNQRNVAAVFDSHFGRTGTLPTDLAVLTPHGLSLASGETSTGAITGTITSTDLFLDLLSGQGGGPNGGEADPMAFAEHSSTRGGNAIAGSFGMNSSHAAEPVIDAGRWASWGAVYGGATGIDGDPTIVGSQDVSSRTVGIAGGLSRRFGDGSVGAALGGGWSRFSLANGFGGGRLGQFNAGIHANRTFGSVYLAGALTYGYHDVSTSRTVGAGTLSASFGAHSFAGRAEAGYRFETAVGGISPYAAFQAINTQLPAYAEAANGGAGPFALNYAASSTTATRAELGARFEHVSVMGGDAVLKLTARAAWAINGGTARRAVAAFQSLGGSSFVVDGASPDRHSALLDAGVEAAFSGNQAAALTLRGEISENVTSFGAKARYTYRW